MRCRMLPSLLALCVFGVLLIFSPLGTHAIPVAGNYQFTNGLTGTFISDGTKLTAWNIHVPYPGLTGDGVPYVTHFCNTCLQPVHTNDSDLFFTFDLTQVAGPNLAIGWTVGPQGGSEYLFSGEGERLAGGAVSFRLHNPTSVPEPSSGLLLLAAALALLSYGRLQPHRIRLQLS